MCEQWRPVVGFEGRYEVSDLGQARSLISNAGTPRLAPKILKLTRQTCKIGYLKVGLWSGCKLKNALLHTVVLEAFVGPRPPKHQGAHLDGNVEHNSVANLAWKTVKDNNADKVAHGTQTRGEQHHRSKLNDTKVRKIRAAPDTVHPAILAEKYGVALPTINSIRSRATWRHVQ